MATAISQKTLDSATPAVYAEVTYTSSRSGNNMVYDITVSAWITSSGGWRNNRWAAKLWVNGTAIWTNATLKAQTSGAIGTGKYSATAQVKVAVNSGTVPIKVQFADTGWSTDWSVNVDWGTYEGTLAVTAPSAPSVPSSITIPSAAAPDQTISISWGASSGGTNGVTGYEYAYSKDGGSNYTAATTTSKSASLNLNSLGFKHGSVLKCRVRSYSTVNGTKYYSDWKTSGTITTNFVAPSVPSSVTIPSSAAPDQTVSISWGASSGGTNGVKGYQYQYSKDGGNTWQTAATTTATKLSLNLNSAGFVHGSKLAFRVRSYTTGQSTNYYSGWKTSGSITTSFVAPSAPTTVTIPSAIAPDKTASISWSGASGGTNGVKGYQWQWSKDGGSTWSSSITTTSTSATLNLNSNSFIHGSKLAIRVRAYTTGQSTNYYSGWKTSGTTTTSFVAPSAPQNAKISTDMEEPIPTGVYKASWTAPSSTGSNGIGGYKVQWLKNGANFGSEVTVTGTSATKTVTESDIQPGDTISFKVRAYTVGQSTNYYSGYTTSGTITIVSDKFIFISQNGGSFVKYKAFISVNGGSFTEIKKEKLKVI